MSLEQEVKIWFSGGERKWQTSFPVAEGVNGHTSVLGYDMVQWCVTQLLQIVILTIETHSNYNLSTGDINSQRNQFKLILEKEIC